jgi:hypothetical protein
MKYLRRSRARLRPFKRFHGPFLKNFERYNLELGAFGSKCGALRSLLNRFHSECNALPSELNALRSELYALNSNRG